MPSLMELGNFEEAQGLTLLEQCCPLTLGTVRGLAGQLVVVVGLLPCCWSFGEQVPSCYALQTSDSWNLLLELISSIVEELRNQL